MEKLDLAGKQFGRWTVIRLTDERTSNGGTKWFCECKCGSRRNVNASSLVSGKSQNCGCVRKEINKLRCTTHGMHKKRIYQIWQNMKARCTNKKSTSYSSYGGRGITVCKRWLKFENFFKDMGNVPTKLSIERIDNNGNYESGNCKFATSLEQAQNKRPHKNQKWFYGHGPRGEMIIDNSLGGVSRAFGLNHSHISACLLGKFKQHKNWTFQRII